MAITSARSGVTCRVTPEPHPIWNATHIRAFMWMRGRMWPYQQAARAVTLPANGRAANSMRFHARPPVRQDEMDWAVAHCGAAWLDEQSAWIPTPSW